MNPLGAAQVLGPAGLWFADATARPRDGRSHDVAVTEEWASTTAPFEDWPRPSPLPPSITPLTLDLLVHWRARPAASMRVADALGLSRLGWQISGRIDLSEPVAT